MNYFLHYERLINRAKNRKFEGYFERHHIIPKCMGGNNASTNLVKLTASEHFVAHQLLCKMYPKNKKLVYAVYIMTLSTQQTIRNNKEYNWIRKIYSENHQARGKPAHNKSIPVSDTTRSKMSAAKKDFWRKNPNLAAPNRGIPHSNDTKRKIKESVRHRHIIKVQCLHCRRVFDLGNFTNHCKSLK